MSLKPVATRLAELLGSPVAFADDCVGPAVAAAGTSGVVLLENLRFHPEEEKNDAGFAKQLAEGIDVYVNDAFGSAHRAHASTEGIVAHVPVAAAGLLMAAEVAYLGKALHNPDRPFVAILGGAKVSDKLEVIENLLGKVDALCIGGAMAYTFLKSRGVAIGKSLVEDDLLDKAKELEARAAAANITLALPTDHVVAPKLEAGAPSEVLAVTDPAIGDRMGLDIGPETDQGLRRAGRDGEDGGLERPDGRVRDRRVRQGHQRGGRGGRQRQGHDDHRRRRLDCGGRQGRRRRSHQPHLDGRRRVARVPRRPDPARRRRPAAEDVGDVAEPGADP